MFSDIVSELNFANAFKMGDGQGHVYDILLKLYVVWQSTVVLIMLLTLLRVIVLGILYSF